MGLETRRLVGRFRQLGGFTLLGEYARIGALPTLAREVVRVCTRRLPAKEVYPALERKVQPVLRRRYEPLMHSLIEKYRAAGLPHERSGKVWFCWLQGIDEAPPLVKACCESQRRNLAGKSVEVISYGTYGDFITLPEHIVRKHKEGKIPHQQFSDIIRLELLIKHAGTWIDSTVLCTGSNFPGRVLDCDLFLFQYRERRTGRLRGFSNWFITSCTNNLALLVLRDMLYQYWRDYDCVMDYYIFHLFFSMIIKACPDAMAAMPWNDNSLALMLGGRIREEYDDAWMEKLVSVCAFHKLNYRIRPAEGHAGTTFYDKIIRDYIKG